MFWFAVQNAFIFCWTALIVKYNIKMWVWWHIYLIKGGIISNHAFKGEVGFRQRLPSAKIFFLTIFDSDEMILVASIIASTKIISWSPSSQTLPWYYYGDYHVIIIIMMAIRPSVFDRLKSEYSTRNIKRNMMQGGGPGRWANRHCLYPGVESLHAVMMVIVCAGSNLFLWDKCIKWWVYVIINDGHASLIMMHVH